jgi:hypothetical protein
MTNDPIVEEIRGYRQQHAAQFGHDLGRIVEDLRQKERHSTHPLLNPGPKRIEQAYRAPQIRPECEVREVGGIDIPSREERNARG